MEPSSPPAGTPVWDHVRLRYEQAQETVAQIAASISMKPHALTLKARAEGWLLRSVKPAKPKPQSTRDTLRRLKDVLQQRLSQLEHQLAEVSEEISALANERDIRATNTLVRTLEKVLELEHKERKQRSQRARQTRKLNDAERDELARRIAQLQEEPEEIHQGDQPAGSDRPAVGLAELGEIRPAGA